MALLDLTLDDWKVKFNVPQISKSYISERYQVMLHVTITHYWQIIYGKTLIIIYGTLDLILSDIEGTKSR